MDQSNEKLYCQGTFFFKCVDVLFLSSVAIYISTVFYVLNCKPIIIDLKHMTVPNNTIKAHNMLFRPVSSSKG